MSKEQEEAKEQIVAVYWWDARDYGSSYGEVPDLSRMPYMRTIGVIRTYEDGEEVIMNIEYNRFENTDIDIMDKHSEGMSILKRWVHKIVPIGKI